MDSDKAKATIKSSANTLFRKYGYNKTSVNEIAAGAKLAKATLYKYFDSKEQILKELLLAYVKKSFDELLLAYKGDRTDPSYLSYIILKISRLTYAACNEYMGWEFIRESTNAQEFLKVLSDELEEMLYLETIRIRNIRPDSEWAKSIRFLIKSSKSIVASFAFVSTSEADVRRNFLTFRNDILPYLLKGVLH